LEEQRAKIKEDFNRNISINTRKNDGPEQRSRRFITAHHPEWLGGQSPAGG